jgi:hypothetical protein
VTRLISSFLGELERDEAALLSWGLIDGSFSEEELFGKAEEFQERNENHGFAGGYELLEEMVACGLLFRWEEESSYRYRTRMAESVRLLSRLRQLFPKHMRQRGAWSAAPTLVSDFRLLVRPRQYPRRDQAAIECIRSWVGREGGKTPLQERVMHRLLGVDQDSAGLPLAGFQRRATERILNAALETLSSATMISSGTGSGKTLAFYLPAITQLAGMLERDQSSWTRVLALYPRNELLKDQLTETIRQTRRVKHVLKEAGRRPIQVGAYFGPTPNDASSVADNSWGTAWIAKAGGRVCPFLGCPDPDCGGPLLWRDEDRANNTERLLCAECGGAVEPDEIALTRRRITNAPPDILFSTTEMLNQRLTDARTWHLFGVGMPPARRPSLVLLDEAHTYEGSHGAQVAYLLRRWRHRSQATPHFVGLSATLMEAGSFLAGLTGLPLTVVEEIKAEAGELVDEGGEYLLALRGDPVSGASLLSTTIQAAMLLRRVLDPRPDAPSRGEFGQKIFLFTDDLDVTNRMFFNLLDAEGQDHRGRMDPLRHPQGSLANLRSGQLGDEVRRFNFGQSWRLPEELGHELRPQNQVRIGRVSSQDSGVDVDAEIIVATSALEVGFNDPSVGAILQHKAPRGSAAFLQRKGRAGRSREMRPWTVVVLSDFGRDRLAYQGYDLLFDPELKPRELPLGNSHVQKMQATYACLDWVALNGGGQTAHFWRDASRPALDESPPWMQQSLARQRAAGELLASVMQGGDDLDRLTDWLRRSLRLSEDEVRALLWDSPRALMLSVIPTLHRRLTTQWLYRDEQGGEYHKAYHPLPEFIPSTLFGELNLPEVAIIPEQEVAQDSGFFSMSVSSALREFAPGRISRRFGIAHGSSRHWIPVDPDGPPHQLLAVENFCGRNEWEDIGLFTYFEGDEQHTVRVLRPFTLHVRGDAPRESVKDSSNAFLRWDSQLLAPTDPAAGLIVDLPDISAWAELIAEIRFFCHLEHQPVQVRRFTRGADTTLRGANGITREIVSEFVSDGPNGSAPVALGFAFEADAIRIQVSVPGDWVLSGENASAAKLPALRADRFRWRLLSEPALDGIANSFERTWLAEVSLSAVVAEAMRAQLNLQDAWSAIRAGASELSFGDVLDVVFQALPTDDDYETVHADEQERLKDLRQCFDDEKVLVALDNVVPALWSLPDESWHLWLTKRFLATIGAAFREAIQQTCLDVDAESLLVDLYAPGAQSGELATIWISEASPGGGGIIERLVPKLAESPRRFLDILRSALEDSDFDLSNREIRKFLQWNVVDRDLGSTANSNAVRGAKTLEELKSAFARLHTTLRNRGMQTTHSVMTALSTRLLKPGSSTQTDSIVLDMITRWDAEEIRLGIEIDARPLAYALSSADDLDHALSEAVLPMGNEENARIWRFSALSGLLWPRGTQARNHQLALRNPYATILPPERLLVADLLMEAEPRVEFGPESWLASCHQQLIAHGRINLQASLDSIEEFQQALFALLVNAIDTGSLLLYPRLRRLTRVDATVSATLELTTPGQIEADGSAPSETSTTRLIIKAPTGNRDEIRDLLESLLAVEMLLPSNELWLVSPWISDIPLLDNRAGGYGGLDPAWPKRHITLAELVAFRLRMNLDGVVRVVTRPGEHTARFLERLKILVGLDGNSGRLLIDSSRSDLHTKGLVTTAFAVNGSMNFTYNGIEVLDETLQLETELARVAQFRLSFHSLYP